jgi:hypothetical protein
MLGDHDERMLTYQWLLRALGAYLDEQPSCRITLAEVSDGFVVRLQRSLHKLEPQVIHVKRRTLEEQLAHLGQRRSVAGHARHQGIWSKFPNGHQDFFRALGYELDQAGASSILIDELEDGVSVSYSHPEPANGTVWKKKHVVLGMDAIEEILNEAYKRRNRPAPQS